MEQYIKKYFWLLPPLVIALCAYFGAKAASHMIESKALGDSSTLGQATRAVTKPSKTPEKRSKVGEPIATRNMFCSSCLPPEPEVDDDVVVDSNSPPITSLPLRLLATNVSSLANYSFATIQNTSTDRQGAYSIDQEIPDGGPVVRISAKFVDFENPSTKRVERISLLSTKPPPAPKVASKTPSRSVSGKPKDDLMDMIDQGVNKVSDTEFEIDKKVVDKVLENPMSVARGARIVPSIKNGKANGFKLYAIRPSSAYAKIGLMNGDTIHSINGLEMNASKPDKLLEIYAKLGSATSLSVTATRRGKPVTLNYSIK